MKEILRDIMQREIQALNDLLLALEEQHKYIAHNELINLAAISEKIDECNKNVARIEVERRKITNGESMKKLVHEINDNELEACYRDANKLLQELKVQKDTNELLIRQGLSFSNQMLNLLKPDRAAKTYNAYGRSK